MRFEALVSTVVATEVLARLLCTGQQSLAEHAAKAKARPVLGQEVCEKSHVTGNAARQSTTKIRVLWIASCPVDMIVYGLAGFRIVFAERQRLMLGRFRRSEIIHADSI